MKKRKNPYNPQMNKLEKEVSKTIKKLNADLKHKKSVKYIEEDYNKLIFLLGECNYLAKEFHLFQKKIK